MSLPLNRARKIALAVGIGIAGACIAGGTVASASPASNSPHSAPADSVPDAVLAPAPSGGDNSAPQHLDLPVTPVPDELKEGVVPAAGTVVPFGDTAK